jgi:NADH-quinone oxidoreductase subunit M
VYTLNMIQKIFFGPTTVLTDAGGEPAGNERLALVILVGIILFFGVYPQPLLNLTDGFVTDLLKSSRFTNLPMK